MYIYFDAIGRMKLIIILEKKVWKKNIYIVRGTKLRWQPTSYLRAIALRQSPSQCALGESIEEPCTRIFVQLREK